MIALTVPFSPSPRICFDSGFLLDTIPGWEKPMALPHAEKKAMLASPDGRNVLRQAALQPTTGFKVSNWAIYVINETFAPENKQWEGKSVAEIAKARGVDEFDALCDIVVADDLMTGFGFPMRPDDDETWQVRMKVWRDSRAVIGASDAGAHLDFLATFNYSTVLLGGPVRERGLMPIEEAINLLTDVPARLYGLTGRGRLEAGWHADVVVIDPETVGAQEVRMRFDLPTGAPRLYGGANGIDHVLVNGTEIVDHGEFTDAPPGRCCARVVTPRPSRFRAPDRGPMASRRFFDRLRRRGLRGAPGRPALDLAPGLPERDAARVRDVITELLSLHDTMTQRAEAAAVADAYLALSDDGRRNFLLMLARDFWTDSRTVDDAVDAIQHAAP